MTTCLRPSRQQRGVGALGAVPETRLLLGVVHARDGVADAVAVAVVGHGVVVLARRHGVDAAAGVDTATVDTVDTAGVNTGMDTGRTDTSADAAV